MLLLNESEYTGRHPIVVVKRLPYSGQYAAHRNRLYLIALAAAADPGSELFHRDRRTGKLYRRSGASHRCAFWSGYAEALGGPVSHLQRGEPSSDNAVMYRAGKVFGKADLSAQRRGSRHGNP